MQGFLYSMMLAGIWVSADANAQGMPSQPAAFQRPNPAGQLIDIGGRKLHLVCTGPASGPTVVVEAAAATWSSHYVAMQSAIAQFARICTYDRAGLGWSDPAPAGRSFQDMKEDLVRLLNGARVAPPYVLVGHSLGGLVARLYASEHSRDVKAVLLVESSSETINFTPEYVASRVQRIGMIDSGLKVGKPGVPVMSLPPGAAPEAVMAMLPEILQATKDELGVFERTPEAMKVPGGFGSLGNIPLVVIRRGRMAQPPNAGDIAWQQAQEKLLELSRNSKLVVAEKSGHMVPIDEPQLVADTIKSLIGP